MQLNLAGGHPLPPLPIGAGLPGLPSNVLQAPMPGMFASSPGWPLPTQSFGTSVASLPQNLLSTLPGTQLQQAQLQQAQLQQAQQAQLQQAQQAQLQQAQQAQLQQAQLQQALAQLGSLGQLLAQASAAPAPAPAWPNLNPSAAAAFPLLHQQQLPLAGQLPTLSPTPPGYSLSQQQALLAGQLPTLSPSQLPPPQQQTASPFGIQALQAPHLPHAGVLQAGGPGRPAQEPIPSSEGLKPASSGPPHPSEAASSGSSPAPPASEPPRCHLHKKPSPNCKKCKQVAEAQSASLLTATPAVSSSSSASASGSGAAAEEETSKVTFNCGPMLRDQILKTSYFKSLLNISNIENLVEEIVNYADGIDVYQAGSATSPSIFFCCAYRVFTLEPTEDELHSLVDHASSALVRCVGFIYMRYFVKPDRLWDMFEEYILDEMKLEIGLGSKEEVKMTVGDYVEALLMKEKYFGTPLPRLPVTVRRKLEEQLAPISQYRKRAQVNGKSIKLLREKGTAVEVCRDGGWLRAEVIELAEGRRSNPSRPKLRVRLLEERGEILVHIGRVVLGSSPDNRSRSRSRGRRRGASPDWLRWKGKSDEEMVRELRERAKEDAVCGSGKDYARRPYGFEMGLALKREQGSQEKSLLEEDTFQEPRQRRRATPREQDDEEAERQSRRKQQDDNERQRGLAKIFEKYGGGGGGGQSGSTGARASEVERPDVMRLG